MKLLFGASTSRNSTAFTQQLIQVAGRNNSVIVGAKTNARHKSMLTSKLMALLETGDTDGRIPASPVIAITANRNNRKYARIFKSMVTSESSQAQLRTAMVAVGKVGVSDLINTIQHITHPENADATVARKGFNKRYVHTGLVQRQLGYQLVTNDEAAASSKPTANKLRRLLYAYRSLDTKEFMK